MNKQQAGNNKTKGRICCYIMPERNGSSVHYLTANPVI
jgi:hypothetical protein